MLVGRRRGPRDTSGVQSRNKPLFAVGTAALSGSITLVRRGAPMVAWTNAAKGLLWGSVLIVLIAIPKAP